MPRWTSAELHDAPSVSARNGLSLIGPGLVMGAAAIGGGEWLAGPAVTARYGGALLWVATISIVIQTLYNIEISRYTLYTGEPIFTGKFRTLPGPGFWLVVYLLLDWGSLFPYLAVNAAVPLESMWLGDSFDPAHNPQHWWIHKWVATGIFTAAILPLLVGGKVYRSLKLIMSAKLVIIFGFLLIVSIFFSRPASWLDIASGFFKIGTLPVVRDGGSDEVRSDSPASAAVVGASKLPVEEVHVENVLLFRLRNGHWPTIDFSLIATIAALAAIAGNGGLTNTPISNFTRDQGWGMGRHVGAIPRVIGGRGLTLSHVGCVFPIHAESLARWGRWVRHVRREQIFVWMGACLVGVGLPSILSVEFLPRGTKADDWVVASMTAGAVGRQVADPPEGVLAHSRFLRPYLSGPRLGGWFRATTLFCGFLVLATGTLTTMDGFIRRWVDVIWTSSPRMRRLETDAIRYVYFAVLMGYCVFGYTIIWLTEKPGMVFKVATTGYNFAFAFSCWHTLAVNTCLLPRELRPSPAIRLGLVLGGCFFLCLGILAVQRLTGRI
jgi:hypothetical protein